MEDALLCNEEMPIDVGTEDLGQHEMKNEEQEEKAASKHVHTKLTLDDLEKQHLQKMQAVERSSSAEPRPPSHHEDSGEEDLHIDMDRASPSTNSTSSGLGSSMSSNGSLNLDPENRGLLSRGSASNHSTDSILSKMQIQKPISPFPEEAKPDAAPRKSSSRKGQPRKIEIPSPVVPTVAHPMWYPHLNTAPPQSDPSSTHISMLSALAQRVGDAKPTSPYHHSPSQRVGDAKPTSPYHHSPSQRVDAKPTSPYHHSPSHERPHKTPSPATAIPHPSMEPLNLSKPSENPSPPPAKRVKEEGEVRKGEDSLSVMKDVIKQEHEKLVHELDTLCKSLEPKSRLHQLRETYISLYNKIENERYQALTVNILNDSTKRSLHTYYDQELLLLLQRTQYGLVAEKMQLGAQMMGSLQQLYNPYMMAAMGGGGMMGAMGAAPPAMLNLQGTKSDPKLSPLAHANLTSVRLPETSPTNEGSDTSQHSPSDSPQTSPGSFKQRKRKASSMQGETVLSEWFRQNAHYPFPDDATITALASLARMQPNKVKQWLSDKQLQTSHSQLYDRAAHIKELERIVQNREASPDRNVSASFTPSQLTYSPSLSGGRDDGKPQRRTKRSLHPEAVRVLNTWYSDHISYPYPNDSEKKQLCEESGLTMNQVTCWFANKRNRCNNTRKAMMTSMV